MKRKLVRSLVVKGKADSLLFELLEHMSIPGSEYGTLLFHIDFPAHQKFKVLKIMRKQGHVPTLRMFNRVIDLCGAENGGIAALEVFKFMKKCSVVPATDTLKSLLKHLPDLDMILKYQQEILELNPDLSRDSESYNRILWMLGKKDPTEMLRYYEVKVDIPWMKVQSSTFFTILASLLKSGMWYDSFKCFDEMVCL